jgi:hypothetical protein
MGEALGAIPPGDGDFGAARRAWSHYIGACVETAEAG